MTNAQETLLDWLRDAHAMEEQAETLLSSQAGRLKDHPEVKAGVERHLEVTRRQAHRLEACISRHGGSASSVKDVTGKLFALGQSFSGVFAADEVVKSCLAMYTFEQMEVASYRILMEAADVVGDPETRRVCEEILREEEAMAEWVSQQFASITRSYLAATHKR